MVVTGLSQVEFFVIIIIIIIIIIIALMIQTMFLKFIFIFRMKHHPSSVVQ